MVNNERRSQFQCDVLCFCFAVLKLDVHCLDTKPN